MSDHDDVSKSLRDRLGGNEDRLGKALSELLESPLLTGAIGRAFDAREKAAQAQEVALGALNIPSAADIERLTRRLRSVSHRLEAIEDGVDRLDRALSPSGVEVRLAEIESQLRVLSDGVQRLANAGATGRAAPAGAAKTARRKPAKDASAKPKRSARARPAPGSPSA